MSGFSSPIIFRGASASMAGTQSIPDSTNTTVNWNGSEDYDTDSMHDLVTNNSRIVVPSGVTFVRVYFAYDWASSGTGGRAAYIVKNGSNIRRELKVSVFESSSVLSSGPVAVVGGDYFECVVWQSSGGALNLAGGPLCRFVLEIIK